jgi:hypothetical protein
MGKGKQILLDLLIQHREHLIFAIGAGIARANRKNGERALILRAQSARKISALNGKYTSEMLPIEGY